MLSSLTNRCRELQTVIEPFADLLDHAHGGFSADTFATGSQVLVTVQLQS